jgi:hypothetical protein
MHWQGRRERTSSRKKSRWSGGSFFYRAASLFVSDFAFDLAFDEKAAAYIVAAFSISHQELLCYYKREVF